MGTNAIAVATELSDFLSSGGTKTLGALVFWSLSGVNIPRGELRREFTDAGLQAAVPRDPKISTMLTTAVGDAMVGQRDLVARRFGAGWAVQLEQKDPEDDRVLRYTQILTMVPTVAPTPDGIPIAWKYRGTVAQLARAQVVRDAIALKFAQTRDYLNTSDLSTILVNLMHGTSKDTLLGAVSLRERTGGLYFVHAKHLEDARLVREILERLSPKSVITIMTLMGDADNLAAAAAAARRSFETQLKELREEVLEFKATLAKDDKTATDRQVELRTDRYQQLRDRVLLFSDVLGDISGELTREIDAARDALREGLGL